MRSSVISSLCFLSGFLSLVSGASIPRYFEGQPTTRRSYTSQEVRRELGSQVSPGTLIYGPDDAEFAHLTSRWTEFSKPDVRVVIEPAAESDVSKIVRFIPTTSTTLQCSAILTNGVR
jgi:antirestriction protein ArdC